MRARRLLKATFPVEFVFSRCVSYGPYNCSYLCYGEVFFAVQYLNHFIFAPCVRRISEDRARERFVLIFLNALNLVRIASLVRALPALLFLTFAHLKTNHVKLSNNRMLGCFEILVYHRRSSSTTSQILGTVALLKVLTIRFDGTNAFVDL